ncbi:hypothetical protein PLUTE_a4292 [Pseudoalteromonas luteoviolacea DSM 6061]|nr:hypothetical protein [Pseudoalteromonas luteoviolacea DSM 6061]
MAQAEKLENVAEASRLSSVSHNTSYRHHERIKQGGVKSLKSEQMQVLNHRALLSEPLRKLSSNSP